jgi:DNA-binding transcriptional regulator WhiA
MGTVENQDNRHSTKVCVECGSTTTSMEKTQWGIYPHWYGTFERPVCKKCYVRRKWQEKYVPKDAKCFRCKRSTSVVSRYGTPIWVRDKNGKNVYYCKGCFVILRDTGQVRPQEARKNIGNGIHKALDKGIIFGRTQYTLDESIFDTITEDSAYWMGKLISDGNISRGKTGNPRIALTLAKVDYLHLVKFSKFLKCTNPILPKKKKYRGIIVIQYYLRFSSKHIAEILISHGIVPRKSLIARAIGLENNRHFWRGVFDGDGYFKNKDGKDGDKMILTGSNDLCAQLEEYIRKNVPDAKVTIKKIREYSKLYIYSDTARAVAKLLYSDCKIALQRKYVKARRMFQWWR